MVECKKAQPKEVMLPTLTRSARTRTYPYLDAGGASYLVAGFPSITYGRPATSAYTPYPYAAAYSTPLSFVDPQVNATAGATFYHPSIALAPSPAPHAPSIAFAPDAAAMAMARVGGVNAPLTPSGRLDSIGSATQSGLAQLATGSSADLKKEFVASVLNSYAHTATVPGITSYHPSPSPATRTLAASNATGELIATDPILTQHIVGQNANAQTGMATAIPGGLTGPIPSAHLIAGLSYQ